jgi:salicylate hydroxylase
VEEADMPRSLKVAMIGAGIGGLTAAAALRRFGIDVEVFEQAPQLGEVGAGLQIGPNAVKVIKALGLEDELLKTASEPTNIVSLDWKDASLRFREPLKSISQQEYGARYLTAHRADLHRLLQGLVPESRVHLNTSLTEVRTTSSGAVASFANGHEVECDVLVGADGIHSVVRASLFGKAPARFTNQICWRAQIPMDDVPTRVGPGGSVHLEHGEYSGWIGPTGHVICYPIRAGKFLNIFAGRVSETWVDESWVTPSTNEELLEAYSGWNDALLGMLRKADRCFKWGIYDRDPLQHWVSGRAALLGDAAHPMMPTLAQGAAISIEDGYAFARNLAAADGDAVLGLAAYERERVPRASAVQLQARDQFQDNRKVPAPPPRDRSWIFKHDATAAQS